MTPYFYQFGVGAIVFTIGIYYAARQEYIGFNGKGLRNLLLVSIPFIFFLSLQGFLQFGDFRSVDPTPFRGDSGSARSLGAPVDYGIMVFYFLAILTIGTYFGRRQKTVKDFFFGGQRFPWWLITFSLVATTIGSYSFVKYSRVAYTYGFGSSQTYLNDWIWLPLFIFGWLPILYFSRITSIPEYFERRFDSSVRRWVTVFVLVYLIGYVGVNLFTMGKVLNILLGWQIFTAAALVAIISAIYVTAGGQTSVIMTDLFQGVMLLMTGILILFLGINYLGGLEAFWSHLPRAHKLAFPNFNQDASFPSVGIFWQDGIANTAMFYFLNQGVIMRFMSAKSLKDGRKAIYTVVLVLMPVAACVVASGGWVAKALVHAGYLPPTIKADEAFFIASDFLSRPGVFGLILATMTAALMSTVDTLITAVAAIFVNDIYKPLINPDASEKQLLKMARLSSVSVTLLGILLVPLFMMFKTIYAAHGAFTAAVTPPLVVTLMFSVFWRRFTRKAALYTLVGGMAAIVISLFIPEVIKPFAHGVPMTDAGDGFFAGMTQFKFMRAFYGVVVSSVIGIVTTFFTKPESVERQKGLVWGTIKDAIINYKGSPGEESEHKQALALPRKRDLNMQKTGTADLPLVDISKSLAKELQANPGDLLYLSDSRWWLCGLHSSHAVVGKIIADEAESIIEMDKETADLIVLPKRRKQLISVEKLH
ncbi:MAG: sodium:solute symporter family protein [Deferribacteres bacterium]|nr:sodium:solute symporter family protein [candidate division KSB1 bacterium]MCB9502038.1 sodium:solute symporter family protein [Deferribacteres bacterium]